MLDVPTRSAYESWIDCLHSASSCTATRGRGVVDWCKLPYRSRGRRDRKVGPSRLFGHACMELLRQATDDGSSKPSLGCIARKRACDLPSLRRQDTSAGVSHRRLSGAALRHTASWKHRWADRT